MKLGSKKERFDKYFCLFLCFISIIIISLSYLSTTAPSFSPPERHRVHHRLAGPETSEKETVNTRKKNNNREMKDRALQPNRVFSTLGKPARRRTLQCFIERVLSPYGVYVAPINEPYDGDAKGHDGYEMNDVQQRCRILASYATVQRCIINCTSAGDTLPTGNTFLCFSVLFPLLFLIIIIIIVFVLCQEIIIPAQRVSLKVCWYAPFLSPLCHAFYFALFISSELLSQLPTQPSRCTRQTRSRNTARLHSLRTAAFTPSLQRRLERHLYFIPFYIIRFTCITIQLPIVDFVYLISYFSSFFTQYRALKQLVRQGLPSSITSCGLGVAIEGPFTSLRARFTTDRVTGLWETPRFKAIFPPINFLTFHPSSTAMSAIREVSSNMEGMRGKVGAGSSAALHPLPANAGSSKGGQASGTSVTLANAEVNSHHALNATVPSYGQPPAHRPYTSQSVQPQPSQLNEAGRGRVPSSSSSRVSSQRPSSVPAPPVPGVDTARLHSERMGAVAPPQPEISPIDRHLRAIPYCPRLIDDITQTFLRREREAVRAFNEGTSSNSTNVVDLYRYYASPHYLQYQPDITPKMRVILIDWLIDVHKRFDHHRETLFLTVNIIDRYLSITNTKYKPYCSVRRSKLQLVAVSAYLVATKYEQIIVPDLKEFVLVAAHSYTKKEVLQMEGDICSVLGFRFTVPTSYQFASRLLTVMEDSSLIRQSEQPQRSMEILFHLTNFFLEHALLDYNALQFTPSQVGNAAVFLAIHTLQLHLGLATPAVGPEQSSGTITWSNALKQVSTACVQDFIGCAEGILCYVETIKNNKYQAVRLKYASSRCAEVSKMTMPVVLPHQ
eukprot:gene2040-1230_t